MKLLLDTCVALWYWSGSDSLSQKAAQAIANPANELVLHQISFLEISLKHSLGKLPLLVSPRTLMSEAVSFYGMEYATLSDEDISEMSKLPFYHRDPFDRLLLAHAKRKGLTVVSSDAAWAGYGVPVLW